MSDWSVWCLQCADSIILLTRERSEAGVPYLDCEKITKAIPLLHINDINKNYTRATPYMQMNKTFHRHSFRGSMTAEAAIVVPMVFFIWIACIAWTSVVKVHENVQNTLTNVALDLSLSAGNDAENVKNTGILLGIAALGTCDDLETGGVTKVHNFDFLESSILEDGENITFKVKYRVRLLQGIIPIPEITLKNQVSVRAWTGYNGNQNGEENRENISTYVYVTQYGQVYHKDPLCSHIRLNIFMVTENKAKQYMPCEKCVNKGESTGNTYYITETGECYHSRLGCSGLKRQVDCVLLTEAMTRGFYPCSRCGGE